MFDEKLFEFADIDCADDYIMAKEERSWETVIEYLSQEQLRIDTLIFKPKTNQIRFMFLPCKANEQLTEVFNVSNAPIHFLRKFWELQLSELQNALTQFMVQCYKDKYNNLEADDKTWLTAAVLGGKELE